MRTMRMLFLTSVIRHYISISFTSISGRAEIVQVQAHIF